MISKTDPHLITYLNEHLEAIKPEQQNNAFWFPPPEIPENPRITS